MWVLRLLKDATEGRKKNRPNASGDRFFLPVFLTRTPERQHLCVSGCKGLSGTGQHSQVLRRRCLRVLRLWWLLPWP